MNTFIENRGLQVRTLWLNSCNTVQLFMRRMNQKMKMILLPSLGEGLSTNSKHCWFLLCSARDAYAKLAQRRSEYESSGSEAVEVCYNAQIKVRIISSERSPMSGSLWLICVISKHSTFDSPLTPDNIMSSLGWPACIVYCQQPLTNQRPV